MSTKTLSSIQALFCTSVTFVRDYLLIRTDSCAFIMSGSIAGKIVNDAPFWTVVVPYLGPVQKHFWGQIICLQLFLVT